MALREEMMSFFNANPDVAIRFKELDSSQQNQFVDKVFGSGTQEVQTKQNVNDINYNSDKVLEQQKQRESIPAKTSRMFKGMLGENAVVTPIAMDSGGMINMRKKEDISSPVSKEAMSNLQNALTTAAIPFDALENPIASAAFEIQSGRGLSGSINGMTEALTGQRTGKFSDLVRALPGEEKVAPMIEMAVSGPAVTSFTSMNPIGIKELAAQTTGILASFGLAKKVFSAGAKQADKFKGDEFVRQQAIKTGKITRSIGDRVFKELDGFYTKNNVKMTKEAIAETEAIMSNAPKKLQKLYEKAPKNLKDMWKLKRNIYKEVRNVINKNAKNIPITESEQSLLDVYESIDDTMLSGLPQEQQAILKATNRSASRTLTDTGIVESMVRDKSNRLEAVDTLRDTYMKFGSANNRTYMNRVAALDTNLNEVIRNMKSYTHWHKFGRFASKIGQGLGYATVAGSIAGKKAGRFVFRDAN